MAGVPRRRRGAPGLPWWSVSMAAASAAAAAATVAVAAAAAPSAGAPAATAAAVWRDRAAAAAPWPATRPAAAPAAGVAAGAERQVADAPVATACRATLTIQFFYTQLRVFVVRSWRGLRQRGREGGGLGRCFWGDRVGKDSGVPLVDFRYRHPRLTVVRLGGGGAR